MEIVIVKSGRPTCHNCQRKICVGCRHSYAYLVNGKAVKRLSPLTALRIVRERGKKYGRGL